MSEQSRVRTVTAGSSSFLLREHGSESAATPVLLLHGVPETASCWRDLAPRLARDRRVLAPDLPGLGGTTYSGPYDVPCLVAELAALVEAEVPGGRVDVVGHDWGGSLALGLAGARPDLVRRLVVANAPYRTVPARALHIPFFALPIAPELLFRLGGRRVVDLAFRLLWKAPTPVHGDSLAEYRAAYTRPSVYSAMLGYYRAAARPRLARLLQPGAEHVPVPQVRAEKALVLWGAADPVLPIGIGETVVRDLGADCVMVTVPGAGHFVVEEAPDVVADVLEDFLADEGAPARVHAAPPDKEDDGPMEPPPAVLAEPPLSTPDAPAESPAKKAAGKKAPAARKAPAAKKAAAKRAPAAKKAPPGQTPRKEAPPSSGA